MESVSSVEKSHRVLENSRKVAEIGVSESAGERRAFDCRYCGTKFPNSQALGGHQNAHRRERGLEQRGKINETAGLSNIVSRFYPPSTLSSYNNRYVSVNRLLGVQPHSAIHKPFSSCSRGGVGYGHGGTGGWSSYYNPNRQLPASVQHHLNQQYWMQQSLTVNNCWNNNRVGVSAREYRPPSQARAINLGGTTAFRPPFEAAYSQMGTSSSAGGSGRGKADHRPGGVVAEEEKEEASEIDLTLRL